MESNSNIIGPVLPPGFLTRLGNSNSVELLSSSSSSSDGSDRDDAPEVKAEPSEELESPIDTYGPALPPGFSRKPVIGAALPPGMTKACFGKKIKRDSLQDSDPGEIIGPLPPSANQISNGDVFDDFERRASRMKQKLTTGLDEDLKREEWMTVLPPELQKNFGLGPRSFLRKTPRATGDRSGWTDTPSQRMEKEQRSVDDDREEPSGSKDELIDPIQIEYDEKMSRRAEELNKSGKRAKSLMEIHQKNLKKKKKEEQNKIKERKPFDRDEDLKVNLIDDAKRKALVKQSLQLNDKFSHGKGQFL